MPRRCSLRCDQLTLTLHLGTIAREQIPGENPKQLRNVIPHSSFLTHRVVNGNETVGVIPPLPAPLVAGVVEGRAHCSPRIRAVGNHNVCSHRGQGALAKTLACGQQQKQHHSEYQVWIPRHIMQHVIASVSICIRAFQFASGLSWSSRQPERNHAVATKTRSVKPISKAREQTLIGFQVSMNTWLQDQEGYILFRQSALSPFAL